MTTEEMHQMLLERIGKHRDRLKSHAKSENWALCLTIEGRIDELEFLIAKLAFDRNKNGMGKE